MSQITSKLLLEPGAFTQQPDFHSGLTFAVSGGQFINPAGVVRFAPNVRLTLTASTTNYVVCSTAGVISTNTTGFTSGAIPLYKVTTGAAAITDVEDHRPATSALDGSNVANSANVGVIGSIPVWHRIDLAAGANADTDVTLTHKTRIIDAFVVLRGAGVASCVLTVKSTATAITNGMAASGADTALVRAANIDDAAYEIAAGGILRVTSSGGASQPACTVYVLGLRVA